MNINRFFKISRVVKTNFNSKIENKLLHINSKKKATSKLKSLKPTYKPNKTVNKIEKLIKEEEEEERFGVLNNDTQKKSNNLFSNIDNLLKINQKNQKNKTSLKTKEYVFGKHSVKSALISNKRKIYEKVYIHNCNDKGLRAILQSRPEIQVIESTKQSLNRLSNNGVHNGVVLETSPLFIETINFLGFCDQNKGEYTCNIVDVKTNTCINIQKKYYQNHGENEDKKNPVGLYLDEITDPQNMGSLIRTAFFFGIDFIVVPSLNSASLGSTANKASAGALDLSEIYKTDNYCDFLNNSKKNGWTIISTNLTKSSANDDSLSIGNNSLTKFVDINKLSYIHDKTPILLIMGSEGLGVKEKIKNISDYFVSVKKFTNNELDPFSIVDSLNVGVAAGIIIEKILKNN